jgi:5-formyltetrahydrofolate cyclo-ligase
VFVPLVNTDKSSMSMLAICMPLNRHFSLALQITAPSDLSSPLLAASRSDLVPRAFGVPEPDIDKFPRSQWIDALEGELPLDVLVLPGVAFDRRGARLGRGRGFYDAYIQRCAKHARSVGSIRPWLLALCFNEQLVEQVPIDEHDQLVDALATPHGVIEISHA